MKRLLLALAALIALASPAAAHRLKLFVTVEGGEVAGYAFFIGGGRAQGTDWRARDAAGAEIAAGKTGSDGTYRFAVPAGPPQALTITVDTHEGHISSVTLPAERFGGAPATPAAPAAPVAQAATPAVARDDAALAALVEGAVERAVAPLEEQIDALQSRMRLTDIVSGVVLILGLGGMLLYFRGRRG